MVGVRIVLIYHVIHLCFDHLVFFGGTYWYEQGVLIDVDVGLGEVVGGYAWYMLLYDVLIRRINRRGHYSIRTLHKNYHTEFWQHGEGGWFL